MNFGQLWGQFISDARRAEFRKLSTVELRSAWDAFDGDAQKGQAGYFWPDDGPHIEDIHALLNERGEGDYCAV